MFPAQVHAARQRLCLKLSPLPPIAADEQRMRPVVAEDSRPVLQFPAPKIGNSPDSAPCGSWRCGAGEPVATTQPRALTATATETPASSRAPGRADASLKHASSGLEGVNAYKSRNRRDGWMHGGARMRLRLRPTQGGGSVASWQALKIPQPPCKHASAARSLLRLGCGLLSSREAGERNMATTACAVQPQLRSARQIARAPGRRPQRVFAVATGADLLPTWLLAGRLGAAGMIRRLTEHVDNAPTPTAGPARRQAAPAQPPSPPPAPAPAAQAPPPIKIPRSLEEVCHRVSSWHNVMQWLVVMRCCGSRGAAGHGHSSLGVCRVLFGRLA